MNTQFTPNVAPYINGDHFEPYAWPGGYPLYYLTESCEVLCAAHADVESEYADETIIGADINWEDPDLQCAHNHHIESAYAEEE